MTGLPVHRMEGSVTDEMGAALSAFLAKNPGPVRLIINSPGGLAYIGASMAADVERHGQVEALGQGMVLSAATLPFLAASRSVMHSAALFMIHDPAALVFGNAADLRNEAGLLDRMSGTYANLYARLTGHPVARVAAWMAAETWLNADEALQLKFCDAIEERRAAEPVARFDFTRFRHAPEALRRMALENGWAAASPEPSGKGI